MKRNKINIIFCSLVLSILFSACSNTEDKYVISVMFPLSGVGAESGNNSLKALELCATKWNNENNGILDRKITIVGNDCKTDPKLGVVLSKKIVSVDKPNLVFSAVSGVVINAQPILEMNKIINIAIVGTDHLFSESPSYTIRNYVSSSQTTNAILDYYNTHNYTDGITVFYANNELGNSNKDQLIINGKTKGVKIKNAIPYDETSMSYRDIALSQPLNDDDFVYVAGSHAPLARMIRDIRINGFMGKIVCDVDIKSTSAMNTLGQYTSNLFCIEINKSKLADSVAKSFYDIYRVPMDDTAILVYNSLDYILSCLDAMNSLNNDDIMKSLNNFSYNGVLGETNIINNEFIFEYNVVEINR